MATCTASLEVCHEQQANPRPDRPLDRLHRTRTLQYGGVGVTLYGDGEREGDRGERGGGVRGGGEWSE